MLLIRIFGELSKELVILNQLKNLFDQPVLTRLSFQDFRNNCTKNVSQNLTPIKSYSSVWTTKGSLYSKLSLPHRTDIDAVHRFLFRLSRRTLSTAPRLWYTRGRPFPALMISGYLSIESNSLAFAFSSPDLFEPVWTIVILATMPACCHLLILEPLFHWSGVRVKRNAILVWREITFRSASERTGRSSLNTHVFQVCIRWPSNGH